MRNTVSKKEEDNPPGVISMSNRRQSLAEGKKKGKTSYVCVCVGFPRAGSYQSSQSIHHLLLLLFFCCYLVVIFWFVPEADAEHSTDRYRPDLSPDFSYLFCTVSGGGGSWVIFIHSLCINRPPDIRSHLNCISNSQRGWNRSEPRTAQGENTLNEWIRSIHEWTWKIFPSHSHPKDQ
jgi:hypothetical protein